MHLLMGERPENNGRPAEFWEGDEIGRLNYELTKEQQVRFSIDFRLIFSLVFHWFFVGFPLNHDSIAEHREGAANDG